MKKTVLALAAMAVSGASFAQSSVTLFGVIDAGVGYIKADGAGHATGLISGGSSTSRLGFRGTEDLGGGLSASFWLEGAVNNDVGAGSSQTAGFDFQRRSTVSLSGTFGEMRLGRDFAASYLPLLSYDPFGQRGFGEVELYGPGAAGTGSTVRVSNAVSYLLPKNAYGVYGSLQYAFGERSSSQVTVANGAGISSSAANAATDKTGNYLGGTLGYANGRLDISGGLGQFYDTVRTVNATTFYASDYKIANIGASYDFGFVKPMAFAQTESIDGRAAVAEAKFNTYSVGATAPLGLGVLKAQVSRYDAKNSSLDATKLTLGYVYTLSKRTYVYADVSRLANKGNSTTGGNYTFVGVSSSIPALAPTRGGEVTAVAVGIRHAF